MRHTTLQNDILNWVRTHHTLEWLLKSRIGDIFFADKNGPKDPFSKIEQVSKIKLKVRKDVVPSGPLRVTIMAPISPFR